MNGKRARQLRKAVKDLDTEYVVTPIPALRKVYKDLKQSYKRGELNG